ncbi:hypothetical protein [Streptomyces sp. NBC_01237]|uniref:hypothetical protein n=1 Tax=Streptomyces sp. NBC_01237 TaxID=2903790 RepID=UPI002DDAF597|nr:hypothetical protein [Streptomyces sp. NBC_01237]WRZ73773.1 hypothetical protein OG251_20245 [Streptomyces sp. NBC_01237]
MSAQGTGVDPSTLGLTLNNRDGRYSPRNPLSPHFGLLGRNTPIRITVPGGETYLAVDGQAGSRASTPSAGLPTGDIDLRIDLTPEMWAGPYTADGCELIGRYATSGNQRSWRLLLRASGALEFVWSPDGTALLAATSLPTQYAPGQRGAVRVTLDADNGAGGRTVSFYTAPTLAGPWTMLGSPAVQSGTTSLYPSSAPLEIADIAGLGFGRLSGAVHGAEVRGSVGGAPVVRVNFGAASVGAGSLVDSTGRTWSVVGGARIDDRAALFVGEVSAWPSRWAPSGADVWVPIEASGVLRRMQQGRKALASTLRRRIPTGAPVAYWPLEEGREATQAYSPLPGVAPMRTTLFSYGSDATLPGSDPLPTMAAGTTWVATVPGTAVATAWQVEFVYHLSAAPTLTMPLVDVVTGSTVWPSLSVRLGASGLTQLVGTGSDGEATTLLINGGGGATSGQWNRLRLTARQDGALVRLEMWIIPIGGAGQMWSTSYTGQMGAVRRLSGSYGSQYDGMALGHLAVFPSATPVFDFADHGYTGETAAARALRVSAEEGQPLAVYGDPADSMAMGPQPSQTLVDLLHECAEADGGILMERPGSLGLAYRPRTSLYNQGPTLTLDYAAGQIAPPLEPVEDDQSVRNDITVTRTGGGSGRAVVEAGPLSVLPPEQGGVGIYDEAIELNLATDGQAQPIAAWLAHCGTVDEPRWPSIRVQLHRHPELIPAVLRLRVGDLIRLNGLPPWAGAASTDLHVMQIQHEPRPRAWVVTLVGAPASPYHVGVVGDGTRGRVDTSGSQLAADATAAAAALSVTVTAGRPWITSSVFPADFPFNVKLGGEVVTVTAISGTGAAQTFSVIRAVNGIVKPHSAGADVRLADPTIVAL